MSGSSQGFEWYDYVIFVATLLFSLGIGIYYGFVGSGQKTTKEYLQGDRKLKVIPVALSMFMSYISAILVLGNTAEMYQYGPLQWFASIGSSLAYVTTAFLFVPLFYPLRITSAFQYLDMRFKSRVVRQTGTFLIILSQVLYMGIAMYSPATALDAVTGFPTWASVLATGVVATIYTTMGGMKAVIWTDVFQAGVMMVGIVTVLIVGSDKVGGFGKVMDISEEWGRMELNFTFDPLVRISFWSVLIGRFVSSTQTVGTGQTGMQRYCSLPTMKKGQWSVLLNIPLMLIIYTLTCMVGFVVFAYYTVRGCDPLRSGEVSNSNQLLPYFITNELDVPGLPGLFVAVLFSGALSTLSSSLNSLSAVAWKDMLEWKYYYLEEDTKANVTKLLVGLFGVLAVATAFMVEVLGSHVLQASQSFVSGTAGPLLGIFVLGAFFPWANWIGAAVGAWVGLILAMVCTVGSYVSEPYGATLNTTVELCHQFTNETIEEIGTDDDTVFPLFRMSFLWFAALGTITTVGVGFFVSIVTGPTDPKDLDPRLVIPVFDRLLCCLPKRWRDRLYCGMNYADIEYDEAGNYIYPDEEGKDKTTFDDSGDMEMNTKNGVLGENNYHTEERPTSGKLRFRSSAVSPAQEFPDADLQPDETPASKGGAPTDSDERPPSYNQSSGGAADNAAFTVSDEVVSRF